MKTVKVRTTRIIHDYVDVSEEALAEALEVIVRGRLGYPDDGDADVEWRTNGPAIYWRLSGESGFRELDRNFNTATLVDAMNVLRIGWMEAFDPKAHHLEIPVDEHQQKD